MSGYVVKLTALGFEVQGRDGITAVMDHSRYRADLIADLLNGSADPDALLLTLDLDRLGRSRLSIDEIREVAADLNASGPACGPGVAHFSVGTSAGVVRHAALGRVKRV